MSRGDSQIAAGGQIPTQAQLDYALSQLQRTGDFNSQTQDDNYNSRRQS